MIAIFGDLAEAFHKLGNKVIISGRRRANLEEVVAANPGMEEIEPLDITNPASISAAAARLPSGGLTVPEVVLEDAPEAVRQLHREFVRAGSDVVEAFTYYGHREKLKVIGKEDILEPLNRQALQIAKEVVDARAAPCSRAICPTPTPTSRTIPIPCTVCARRSRNRSAGRSMPVSTSSSARPSAGPARRA